MYVLRPLQQQDLRSLERFALSAGAGITNLPPDRVFLQGRIDNSLVAFSESTTKPGGEYYGFVMDNMDNDETVGTSGIFSRIGVGDPHYCYSIKSHLHHSEVLNQDWNEEVLQPHHLSNGPTEICSLYLLKAHRKGGIGRLLSLGRFLFMAEQSHRFTEEIVAEMRGVSENCSVCPFWDHVGRHFLDIEFCDVVKLYNKDKRFIPEFLPEYPIHIALLDNAAKEVIGQPHPNTAPAMRLLEAEGFSFNGQVDLFDAGPTISHARDSIRTIRDSQRLPVGKIVESDPESEPMVASNTELDFRACFAHVASDGAAATITQAVADALGVKEGDTIRFATTRAAS